MDKFHVLLVAIFVVIAGLIVTGGAPSGLAIIVGSGVVLALIGGVYSFGKARGKAEALEGHTS